SLPPGHEASRWMLLPMGLHALGTVVLGVLPAVGFALVIGPVALFMSGVPGSPVVDALAGVASTLSRIGLISGALVAAIVVVLLVRYGRVRKPVSAGATSATWGCGYTLPNARMQYSGASFSSDFSRPFKSIMVLLRRQKAPAGYFPRDSYVVTDCVDAVERRLFNVIDHGDDTAIELSRRLREDDPRVAFAAGLAGVMIIAVLVLLAEGVLR
ncbi:MAG: proton-conducting membrane transporter, partial [Phycisphaerae bacterium]|nr:proton-conducting membrane transporter [Phycisphaerae bacterium]